MKRLSLILFLVFVVIVFLQDLYIKRINNKVISPRMYTVVLSLDGFRTDYQELTTTPNLDSIEKNGVRAAGFQPVFPSLTFVNHYTMATGLYAENHGIVGNAFFDRKLNRVYHMNDSASVLDKRFYGGEPIWVTAESQRIKTATNSWVGADVKIKGYQPSKWVSYNANASYTSRIDSVLKWLALPYAERPHLAMCYIEEADNCGHKFGPDSPEMSLSVQKIDSLVGYLMQGLSQLSFADSINVIIVSDHGMAPLDTAKYVNINNYIKANWIDTIICSPTISHIYCKKNFADIMLRSFNNIDGVNVWKRSEIPQKYHYSLCERVGDVVVVADSGWYLTSKPEPIPINGLHGYSNFDKLMNGVFYAIGPNFKQGFDAPNLYNVDLYSLLCNILELKPANSDSQFDRIKCVLKDY